MNNAIERLRKAACYVMRVDEETTTGRTRERRYVECRQVIMYLAREHKLGSLAKIGMSFCCKDNRNGYDHATVLAGCKTIKNLTDINAVLECGLFVNDVIEKINEIILQPNNNFFTCQADKSATVKAVLGYTLNS